MKRFKNASTILALTALAVGAIGGVVQAKNDKNVQAQDLPYYNLHVPAGGATALSVEASKVTTSSDGLDANSSMTSDGGVYTAIYWGDTRMSQVKWITSGQRVTIPYLYQKNTKGYRELAQSQPWYTFDYVISKGNWSPDLL